MTSLYLRVAAWAIGILGVAAAGAYITHKLDSASYETLAAKYSAYQAQVAQADAAAEAAARAAMQMQITQSQTTETRNAKIITDLTSQRDSAAADRDFANRLLAAAAEAKPPAAGGSMPEATGQPGAAPASGALGHGSLVALLGDAAGECVRNAQRLDALQREIAPQL